MNPIFFRSGGAMMSAGVPPGAALPGKPTRVFQDAFLVSAPGLPNYDVAPDGRFLMVAPPETGAGAPAIHVVLDWFEELKPRR
jgi:hypothetical protein